MRLGSVAVLAATVLLAPRTARPCSPGPCLGPSVAPADGQEIPANTPALYWSPRSGAGTPELFDDFGKSLAITFADDLEWQGGKYVIPKEALQPGAFYRLRYWVDCSGAGSPDGGAWRDHRFKAGSPAPVPSSIGPVGVADGGMREVRVLTSRGSCTYKIPAAASRLAIPLPAEAAPWLSIALVATRVDGRGWATTYWGGFDPAREAQCGPAGSENVPDLVYARCGVHDAGADLYDDNGLEPGLHQAEVLLVIPRGATVRASVDFELTCVDVPGLDGGYPDIGEGLDAGCSGNWWDAPPLRPFATRGCGCGLGAGGTAVALALLAISRRRRR